MQRLVSILATGVLAVTASAQFSLVIPNGMAAAEGSSSNAFPWGRGGTGIRIQTIYDSSHFTAQGITYPILITGLRWRPNTGVALVASNYTALNNTVKLSTCPVDQGAITTTFANQIGADVTTCFTGSVSWGAQAAGTGPLPFGIVVPFQTNFVYDPNLGDLNIECDLPIQTFAGTGPQLDVHATAPLASRMYLTTGYVNGGPNATGTVGLVHGVVVQVDYTPASGLFAAFNANVTGGASPLAVNFTSTSFSSDPGGITSYAWDFDGDSVIDSVLQNPSFVYNTCGTYNVSLTITDASHPPSTLTKPAYIKTDEIVANFTSNVVNPQTVQFTDTSSMAATSWSWDLDGDSIVDSTVQNPLWVYPTANRQNVTLTVNRLCSAPSSITKQVSVVPTLVTPNGFANTVGNTNNAFPWSQGTTSTHIQFIVDSTHFTNQGVTSPILISNLRYRPYPGATTTWAGGSWPTVQIDMATSPVDWAAASTTFANNLGPDLTNVLNGPVTVAAGTTLGVGVVVPWHIDIPLTTSFLYDPTSGSDLTLDIHLTGTGWTGTSRAADHVSTAGVALGSRIYNTTSLVSPTGTVGTSYGAVTEFSYVPATGLYAGFTANVTAGAVPLAVNFTDTTFTSDPGGVTSWAWDLDGDSFIDSTLQNPSFLYTTCGAYTVSLTVTDASHPANTKTRIGYIQAGVTPITPDFTTQVIAPLTVQFTDTSAPGPASWAWDLDGDTITDSTLQNPTWVYPNTNPVNVRLTVTGTCTGPATVTKSIVPVQKLTTTLVPNNSVGTPATLYYNLNVLNPAGMSISSLDSATTNLNTAFTVDFYVRLGTYVGSELNPAGWTWVGQASGTSNAVSNAPSNAAFLQPLYLPAGSYGVAMRYVGITPGYLTLTALTTYANGDVSLTAGAASLSTAGPFTGTNLNTPRGWTGTLYYGTNNVTGAAGYGFFAPGCAGSMGVSHVTNNLPQLGGTLNVTFNNLPLSAAIVMTGFSRTTSAFGPLPLDVTPFGAPGCFARVSPDATLFLFGAGNAATWNFTIPNDPGLNGLQLFNQGLVLDPGFNTLGGVLSDAAGMVIGT